jgi:hypothetical protein
MTGHQNTKILEVYANLYADDIENIYEEFSLIS